MMTRTEFMTELAIRLEPLPENDRWDALQFYEEYFDDAGREKEQDVISELKSPAALAARIIGSPGVFPPRPEPAIDAVAAEPETPSQTYPKQAPFGQNASQEQEQQSPFGQQNPFEQNASQTQGQQASFGQAFTQQGPFEQSAGQNPFGQAYAQQNPFEQDAGQPQEEQPPFGQAFAQQNPFEQDAEPGCGYAGSEAAWAEPPQQRSAAFWVLLAILSPILLCAVIAAFTIFVGAVSLLFAFAATIFMLMVSGLICLPVGFAHLFSDPLNGIFTFSVGLICAGIALMLTPGILWLIKRTVPAMARGLKKMFQAIVRFFRG